MVDTLPERKHVPLAHMGNFDTPDGQNCLYKTAKTSVVTGGIGLNFGVAEMIAYSRPATAAAIAARSLHFCLPAAGAGATYAAVSCLAGSILGQDGGLNHFLGGVGAGLIFGAKNKNWVFGAGLGMGLGLAAMILKLAKIDNFPVYHTRYQTYGNFHHYDREIGPRNTYRLSEKDPYLVEKI